MRNTNGSKWIRLVAARRLIAAAGAVALCMTVSTVAAPDSEKRPIKQEVKRAAPEVAIGEEWSGGLADIEAMGLYTERNGLLELLAKCSGDGPSVGCHLLGSFESAMKPACIILIIEHHQSLGACYERGRAG